MRDRPSDARRQYNAALSLRIAALNWVKVGPAQDAWDSTGVKAHVALKRAAINYAKALGYARPSQR